MKLKIDYNKDSRMARIARKAQEANQDLTAEINHTVGLSNRSEVAKLAEKVFIQTVLAETFKKFNR